MPGRYIRTQSHPFYDCKYHTVFTHQCKGKAIDWSFFQNFLVFLNFDVLL